MFETLVSISIVLMLIGAFFEAHGTSQSRARMKAFNWAGVVFGALALIAYALAAR